MPQVFEDIIVDAEFAALIPPLSAEERQQLEENIVEHGGARDPLVVWVHETWTPEGCSEPLRYDDGRTEVYEDETGGTYTFWHGDDGDSYFKQDWPCTLLDGHNRYEICTRLGLPFDIHEVRFTGRDQARHWIVKNQLGRRNLTADSFTYLLGLDYKLEKSTHGGERKSSVQNDHLKTADRLAKEHGVSPATVRRAEKFFDEVENTPELKKAVEEKRPVLQVKRELKEKAREARREENRQKIAAVPEPEKAASLAQAKYATIVIDPPWDWGDEGDQDQLGRARPDYSTMTIEQLEKLDVGGLADDDCHIYLWITNRSLPKGFRLLEAWGFRYITAITWVKPHFGMGNYFRGQTEHVLFGVKGSQPLKRKDAGTVFNADRGPAGHSSKPPAFLDLVESCSPGPFLEMFSRSSRPGWVAWGENTNAAQ